MVPYFNFWRFIPKIFLGIIIFVEFTFLFWGNSFFFSYSISETDIVFFRQKKMEETTISQLLSLTNSHFNTNDLFREAIIQEIDKGIFQKHEKLIMDSAIKFHHIKYLDEFDAKLKAYNISGFSLLTFAFVLIIVIASLGVLITEFALIFVGSVINQFLKLPYISRLKEVPLINDIILPLDQIALKQIKEDFDLISENFLLKTLADTQLEVDKRKVKDYVNKVMKHISNCSNYKLLFTLIYNRLFSQEQRKFELQYENLKIIYYVLISIVLLLLLSIKLPLINSFQVFIILIVLCIILLPVIRHKKLELAYAEVYFFLDAFAATEGGDISDREGPPILS